jgi:predicted membrane channel-forming protein YqfA (hemolysin III family)
MEKEIKELQDKLDALKLKYELSKQPFKDGDVVEYNDIILTGISYLGSVISCIWALIEFIIYLVKDTQFNWWSVWCILIFGLLALILGLITFVFLAKDRTKKSSFQIRLEEMQKSRIKNLHN